MPTSSVGGMVVPGWKPPAPYTPAPVPAPTKPTFAPPSAQADPATAITSQTDPKIQALIDQLTKGASGGGAAQNPQIGDLQRQILATQGGLDTANSKFSADSGKTAEQSQQLNALLASLMSGKGIDVGPMTNDPEAQAYRVAKTRQAEQARSDEAARLGASGVTGSGDFDARLAQINEAKGADIAGFEADLTGKRRTEATNTAVTGAGLQLSELERQQAAAQAEANTSAQTGATKLGSLQALLSTLTGQEASSTASQQALLAQLLGEQGRVQGSQAAQASAAQQAAIQAEQLRMEQERMRQEIEDRNRRQAGSVIGGVVRG